MTLQELEMNMRVVLAKRVKGVAKGKEGIVVGVSSHLKIASVHIMHTSLNHYVDIPYRFLKRFELPLRVVPKISKFAFISKG